MKIVDANVLLYAVNRQSQHHDASRDWLLRHLSGSEAVGLPWSSLLAFVRISTSRRVFEAPLSASQAMIVVERWLEAPVAITLEPTARHTGLLRSMLEKSGTAGNLTTDAHLAALAVEHAAEVVTFDRDLERFGVAVVVPGVTAPTGRHNPAG